MADPDKLRNLALEVLHLRPQDELAGMQDPGEGIAQVRLNRLVLCFDVEERDHSVTLHL
ncbi:MAG: hypothetical protein AB9869_26930 [Verrucomicrobiia bacterium]